MIGSYYLSEAIFKVTLRLRRKLETNQESKHVLGDHSQDYLTVEDYLVYNDVSFHGTDQEKTMLTFMMMDHVGNGRVNIDGFRFFWQQYIFMYGTILHAPYSYNDQSDELICSTFEVIANVGRGKGGTKVKDHFDLDDLRMAK